MKYHVYLPKYGTPWKPFRNVKRIKQNRKKNFPPPKPATLLSAYKALPVAWIHRSCRIEVQPHWQLCPSPSPTPTDHTASARLSSHYFSLSEYWTPPSNHLNPFIQHLAKYLGNNLLESHTYVLKCCSDCFKKYRFYICVWIY